MDINQCLRPHPKTDGTVQDGECEYREGLAHAAGNGWWHMEKGISELIRKLSELFIE